MATRTWVSGVGDDANPGSRTAPCKTFAGAISKTDASGEIDALDPGGFGAVTITKSLTIDGGTGSGWASILVGNTSGIIINAGNADFVTLRNLSFNGAVTGLFAIRILAAGVVIIENCVISGFRGSTVADGSMGIIDARTAGGTLVVTDTTIRQSNSGILVRPSSGSTRITAAFDNVRIVNNFGYAMRISSGAVATISDSVIAHNQSHGLLAEQPSGTTEVNIERCLFTNNGIGISVNNGTPTVRVSDSAIVNNSTGIALNSGAVQSYKNNRLTGNINGNVFSPGSLNLQ